MNTDSKEALQDVMVLSSNSETRPLIARARKRLHFHKIMYIIHLFRIGVFFHTSHSSLCIETEALLCFE